MEGISSLAGSAAALGELIMELGFSDHDQLGALNSLLSEQTDKRARPSAFSTVAKANSPVASKHAAGESGFAHADAHGSSPGGAVSISAHDESEERWDKRRKTTPTPGARRFIVYPEHGKPRAPSTPCSSTVRVSSPAQNWFCLTSSEINIFAWVRLSGQAIKTTTH